tara:strand:- start:1622 stop:3229 length:1608 start_codon:yes stop_codon:yes gene_type:complete
LQRNESGNIENNNFKTNFGERKYSIGLLALIISGLLIRVYYFPYEIPFVQDVLDFFGYAINTSNFGGISSEWFLANNGWSLFISIFFSIIPIESFFDHIYLQRTISIVISVITVIPVYLLCKQIFKPITALIGGALFIFNPIIIKYSLLGGNDILFTIVITFALYLTIKQTRKTFFLSFILIGILTIIRYEALLLIIPFTILFFYKSKNEKKIIKYFLCMLCFLMIILPFSVIDFINHGEDGLFSHISTNITHVDESIIKENNTGEDWTDEIEDNRILSFILKGFENSFRFILMITLPISIFLFPYGILKIFSNIDYRKLTIICVGFTLLFVAFYAYSRDFQDMKYLIPIIPIFTILSLYPIEKIQEKINKKRVVSVSILSIIILSSISIVEITKIDVEHEKELFLVAQEVVSLSNGYLRYEPESVYIKSAEIEKYWLQEIPNDKNGHVKRSSIAFDYGGFNSLETILKEFENDGLTHIIVDQNENRPNFLKNIFENEENYPYLIKEYDSKNDKLNYNVKIFRIDYDSFNKLKFD